MPKYGLSFIEVLTISVVISVVAAMIYGDGLIEDVIKKDAEVAEYLRALITKALP